MVEWGRNRRVEYGVIGAKFSSIGHTSGGGDSWELYEE